MQQPHLDWLVPGLLKAKVLALIKSLPKPIRRRLVPAPDTAEAVVRQLRFGQGRLLETVAGQLSRIAGERITAVLFHQDKLPPELRMNVRVETTEGETIAEGRDLEAVRRAIGQAASESFAQANASEWDRDGVTRWDFGALPERVELKRGGLVLQAYPAILDRGESIAIRLCESLAKAEEQTGHGLRRLFSLASRRELKSQVQWLPGLAQWKVYAAAIPGFAAERQLADLIAELAFIQGQPAPRDKRRLPRPSSRAGRESRRPCSRSPRAGPCSRSCTGSAGGREDHGGPVGIRHARRAGRSTRSSAPNSSPRPLGPG